MFNWFSEKVETHKLALRWTTIAQLGFILW
jgi:hypothetical protein